jgi:hypothetical protein
MSTNFISRSIDFLESKKNGYQEKRFQKRALKQLYELNDDDRLWDDAYEPAWEGLEITFKIKNN